MVHCRVAEPKEVRFREGYTHTFNNCSKSQAASCFMVETFAPKRWMIPCPNVGIMKNLQQIIREQLQGNGMNVLLLIKFLATIPPCCDEHMDKVCESPLPDPEFKLMHKVRDKQLIDIVSKCSKALGECRL